MELPEIGADLWYARLKPQDAASVRSVVNGLNKILSNYEFEDQKPEWDPYVEFPRRMLRPHCGPETFAAPIVLAAIGSSVAYACGQAENYKDLHLVIAKQGIEHSDIVGLIKEILGLCGVSSTKIYQGRMSVLGRGEIYSNDISWPQTNSMPITLVFPISASVDGQGFPAISRVANRNRRGEPARTNYFDWLKVQQMLGAPYCILRNEPSARIK